ncbi:HEAT repeat domain-containing protein [Cryobacterium zongtaii]|nr:HEAT repeat domain-containing protein [Cryobacterium zongtaii]
MNDEETRTVRAAFTASLFSDPFRTRQTVLQGVAESTGIPIEHVNEALPSPGSPAWVAEFSASRKLLPLAWDRDVDELRAAITGPVDGRWQALRTLLSATVPSDSSRALLLDIIRGTDTHLRISAIESGWRHFEGRSALRDALRELIDETGDERVRVAAIRRVGVDVDRDPRLVTTLLAALSASEPIAVRKAAIDALATSARGYPRAIALVAHGMSDEDNGIRAASFAAVCTLVDDDTERMLVERMVRAGARYEPLVGAYAALDQLRQRRPAVVRSVLQQLSDILPEHRRAAVELASILTGSGDEQAVRAVLAARDDPAAEVRSAVERFIDRLRERNTPRDTSAIWRGTHRQLSPEVEALLE